MTHKPSLLYFVSLLVSLSVSAVLAQSDVLQEFARLQQELQRYEENLENLESEYSPFDPRLLEPLSSIENLHREMGNFNAVLRVQNRRLQLVRTSQGLEHPDTIPLIESIIQTEIQLGNWDAVADQLGHLRTIAMENYGIESDELAAAMVRQADWFQAMLYLGEDRRRARNFMKSREIFDELLGIAEDRYGEDGPELYPWLYDRAYSLYQQVALLNAKSGIQNSMIDETIRYDGAQNLNTARGLAFTPSLGVASPSQATFVDGDEVFGSWYVRRAISYIDDIRDIAEEQGDWETWAIATLYYGDYSFLRGRNSGRGNYRDAYEKLLELGFEQQRLEAFFNRPMIIPAEKFFTNFAELEAYQQSTLRGLPLIPEEDWEDAAADEPWDEPVHAGIFRAWEDGARSAPMPALEDALFAMDLPVNQVDLSFRVNSNGRVSAVDALVTEPDERRIRSRAVRAVRELSFRPGLYEGQAKSRRYVQLRYQILPEDD